MQSDHPLHPKLNKILRYPLLMIELRHRECVNTRTMKSRIQEHIQQRKPINQPPPSRKQKYTKHDLFV